MHAPPCLLAGQTAHTCATITYDCVVSLHLCLHRSSLPQATGELKVSDKYPCMSVGAAPPPPSPSPSAGSELWAKPMSDGKRVAVLLLNNGAGPANLTFSSKQVREWSGAVQHGVER